MRCRMKVLSVALDEVSIASDSPPAPIKGYARAESHATTFEAARGAPKSQLM